MGFEEREPNLMALLNAYVGGNIPARAVVSRPPTLAITHTSFAEVANKKRKIAQGSKGTESAEEGEVTESSRQLPSKEAWTGRGQLKMPSSLGSAKDLGGDQ